MIRGQKRVLDKQPSVNVNLNASIHNRFDIEVVDAKTGEVKQKAQALNVVCDNLWKRLFTFSARSYIDSWSDSLVYGTGSGTPSAADVSLFSYLGRKSASFSSIDYDPATGVLFITKKAQILETEHVGATITEVGLAYSSSSSGNLCTHAMLQDMNGNQVSILKTATDIINLYSTVFVHMEPTKKNGIQLLPVLISRNNSWKQNHVASILSGVATSSTSSGYVQFFATPNVYTDKDVRSSGSALMSADPTEKTWTFGPIRLPASYGNIGGLYGVGFSLVTGYNYNNYYVPFVALFAGDGWFPGSNVVGEAVGTGDGTTTEFALKFPYATEGKVYVDGVEATNVTVERCPTTAKAGYILQLIDPASTLDNIIPYVTYNSLLAVSVTDNLAGKSLMSKNRALHLYNPMWEAGLDHFNVYISSSNYMEALEFSDDLVHWEAMDFPTNISYTNTDIPIPEELRHKKFVRISADSYAFNNDNTGIFFGENLRTKAVVFDTPPAAGAVITADYHTPVIAKDENHVFDVSMTIHCGEYTEN